MFPVDGWPRRLLFAQGLPIAAALQGLEVLHASAVDVDDRTIGIAGPSTAGKTTLAVALVLAGATLLADDVVALDLTKRGARIHAGVRVANVTSDQAGRLATTCGARLVGRTDKAHVLMPPAPSPRPFSALIFLERNQPVIDVEFERLDPPEPWRILGSTFVYHVTSAQRRIRQLEIASELVRHTPMLRVRTPSGMDPDVLAAELRSRLDELVT